MKDIIVIGDGLGVRTLPATAMELDVIGTDINDYAIKNSYCKENMVIDDITNTKIVEKAKLVVAYDILEHISYENIDKTIDNIIGMSYKYILVSVPVIGDPNLDKDSTHIIKETKEWWIKKFVDKGLKLVPVPEHFLFRNQLIILEKKDE